MTDALLAVDDLHTYLGESHVIQGVSLAVPAGQVVALLGRNGAGKTTLLRSIMRMVAPRRGRVTFEGRDISRLATFEIARARIAFVQETRAIFPSLSVECHQRVHARLPTRYARAHLRSVWSRAAAGRSSASSTTSPILPRAATTAACNCPAASSRCWRSRARWSPIRG